MIDWSAQLLRRRLKRNSSQQMSQKNFSIWREELHALAKEFQVSCIIKIDHKQPTINPYFMKKLCRSSWCYHNLYSPHLCLTIFLRGYHHKGAGSCNNWIAVGSEFLGKDLVWPSQSKIFSTIHLYMIRPWEVISILTGFQVNFWWFWLLHSQCCHYSFNTQ